MTTASHMQYPEVTLPEIIGKFGVFIDGDWVESKDQDKDGDVRLLQLADIGVGEYLNKSNRFMTSAKAKALKCTYVLPGDILIARMPDPVGRACIFTGDEKPCVTVVDICILRPDTSVVDSNWLVHRINSPGFQNKISSWITGSTRQRISRGNLSKLKLPLPPLLEQKRIAAILDKADSIRRKRQEAVRLTEELLRSVFLDMFGDPVANPKGWDVKPLCELVNFTTGKLDSNAAVNGGAYPFFTCSRDDLQIDTFAFDCEALLLAGNNASADYSVKHYKGKFNAYQRTYVISMASPSLSYRYMQYALEMKLLDMKLLSKGTNTKYLTLGILNELLFQVPDIAAQSRFEKIIKKLNITASKLRSAESVAGKSFNSLLQGAFRGEL